MTAASSLSETARERRGFGIACFSALIEGIGREHFASRLLDFLDCTVGGDLCTIFQLKDHELTEVASACRGDMEAVSKLDLTPYEVRRRQSQTRQSSARVDVCNLAGANEAPLTRSHKRQRIVICAEKPSAFFCIHIVRLEHRERVSDSKIDDLREIADLLVSLVAQHVEIQARKPNLTPALTSLDEILKCIRSATDLSRREGEVCARLLYGYSHCGIALDLGIGKETVMTYRKRTYQRLGIGSPRELLMWYLALWSASHGHGDNDDVDLRSPTELNTNVPSKLARPRDALVVSALA